MIPGLTHEKGEDWRKGAKIIDRGWQQRKACAPRTESPRTRRRRGRGVGIRRQSPQLHLMVVVCWATGTRCEPYRVVPTFFGGTTRN